MVNALYHRYGPIGNRMSFRSHFTNLFSLRERTPSTCLIDTAYRMGNAGIPQRAAVSSGPEQTQIISASGRYLWILWSIACSVHSLPKFPVPKVPKIAIFGCLTLEHIGDRLSGNLVWFSTTVVVPFIAFARKIRVAPACAE